MVEIFIEELLKRASCFYHQYKFYHWIDDIKNFLYNSYLLIISVFDLIILIYKASVDLLKQYLLFKP